MELTHWIENFAKQNFVTLPTYKPGYWEHPLLHYLGLPKTMPEKWDEIDPLLRFFILLLESFAPPKNLMGLAHQLPPMRHIVAQLVPEVNKDQALECMDDFEDRIDDFLTYHASDNEREILTSRRLKNLTRIGIWRLHFHCAQVDRARLSEVIGLRNEKGELIDARRIAYLKAGQLDPIYEALGPRIHQALRSRFHNKLRVGSIPEQWEDQLRLVYNESLICERALLSAHMLIPPDANLSDPHTWYDIVTGRMHYFASLPSKKKSNAIKKEAVNLQPFIPAIGRAFKFFSSFGKYHPKSRRNRPSKFSFHGHRCRIGRLLPQAMFEVPYDKGFITEAASDIEEPLNILLGPPDDHFSQANLKRHYGLRPSLPRELGESETDYVGSDHLSIPASWVTDPFRQSIKQRVQVESTILGLEPPIWSPPALMIQTVKKYLENAMRRETAIHFLALLPFYTGMLPDSLRHIYVGFPGWAQQIMRSGFSRLDTDQIELINNERNRPAVYLDPDSGCYCYALQDSQVAYYSDTRPDFANDCLPATFLVIITLPMPIRKVLQQWVESEPERFGVNLTESKTLFTRREQAIWAELMAESGRLSNENITPSRMHTTFRSLFSGQMGLPTLYANFISRNFPIQHRSQHFYASVDLAKLNKTYNTAALKIHGLLAKDSDPDTQISDKMITIQGFAGSRIVPRQSQLAQYFSETHASFVCQFEAGIAEPESWNQMMLFVFRLFQLSTGLRPMRDGLPDWTWVNLSLGWVRISDKNNLHFYESRLIPLSSRLFEWLSWLDKHMSKFLLDMNQATASLTPTQGRRICRDIFILASHDGSARPMTMDDLLDAEASIPLSQPWNWKANALRHYLLSTLLDAGADQRLIDGIMGHKHYGGEPFGRFSLMHPTIFAVNARQLIDRNIISPLHIPKPPGWQ